MAGIENRGLDEKLRVRLFMEEGEKHEADLTDASDTAIILLRRASELEYQARHLAERADSSTWQCAKADRYREATRARQTQVQKVADDLRELSRWLQAKVAAAESAPAPGAG